MAKIGDTLSFETARIGMICTDIEGDRVVIDRITDHKRAEVGIWSGGSFGFWGDEIRYDELIFTGVMWSPRPA